MRIRVARSGLYPAVHGRRRPALRIGVAGTDAVRSVLNVRGELDCATAGLLDDALRRELASYHHLTMLDVSGLAFCDAAGLAVLLRAHQKYTAVHGSLVLTGVGPRLARLLQITALDGVLHVAPAGTATTNWVLPSDKRV